MRAESLCNKQTKEFDFPDISLHRKIFTHNLEELLKISGLKQIFETEISTIPKMAVYPKPL